jgi:tetratricopeptide (TPR) repeat protein
MMQTRDATFLLRQAIEAHKQKDVIKAQSGYRQVLQIEPDQPDALYYLGLVEEGQGRAEDAIERLTRSFSIRHHTEVGVHLARMLAKRERTREAINVLQAVCKKDSGNAAAQFDLALQLRKDNQYGAAIKTFRKVLSFASHKMVATLYTGLCYQDIGDLKEAEKWYENCLKLAPNHHSPYYQLCFVRKFMDPADPFIAQLKSVYEQTAGANERSILAFALGKVMDDLKEYEQAFVYYQQANSLKRESFPFYSTDQSRAMIFELLDVFDEGYLARSPKAKGVTGARMIFVFGLPRSGSTLTEQILSAHREVYGAGELDTFWRLVQTKIGARLSSPSQEVLDDIAAEYLRDIAQRAPKSASFVVDKGLKNVNYIPLLAQLFPKAKFVYCQRNPMDHCMSIYRQNFAGNYPYAYNLKEIGAYYRLHETLMGRFRAIVPRNQLYTIEYEALVSNQEEETRKLLDFCGLEWQEQCLHFHKAGRTVHTASAAQVRQPMYRSSVESWKRYGEGVAPLKEIFNIAD